jgi:hypothetical protein
MSSDSDATCPSDEFFGMHLQHSFDEQSVITRLFAGNPVKPIVGDRSFHQIATYISGGCTVISVILCFGLSFMHLCTYRVRSEQRQIARIVLTPAIISIFDFLGVAAYNASGFLKPVGEYYDALALVSLYLLFITYATPPENRGNPRKLYKMIPDLYARHSYQDVKKNELSQYYVGFPNTLSTKFNSGSLTQNKTAHMVPRLPDHPRPRHNSGRLHGRLRHSLQPAQAIQQSKYHRHRHNNDLNDSVFPRRHPDD